MAKIAACSKMCNSFLGNDNPTHLCWICPSEDNRIAACEMCNSFLDNDNPAGLCRVCQSEDDRIAADNMRRNDPNAVEGWPK
jgi:Zn finger protein HypA/HybF involved in hydrogenase expression